MSDFQITGLSSGIDWGNIIDSMISSKRSVQKQWLSEQETIENRITLYKELDVYFKDIRGAMDPLERDATFMDKSAELAVAEGGESFLTVEASADAVIDKHSIEVFSTAASHSVAGNRVDDLNAGLDISGSFSLAVGPFEADITVASGDSLADISGKINQKIAEKAGEEGHEIPIKAKIMDNTLVLSSTSTGADFAMSATDGDGVLEQLGVLDGTGVFARQLEEARDCSLKVDGLDITRSSNSIDDIIEGVKLEINSPGKATAEVVLDAEKAITSVKKMVETYNAAIDWMNIRLEEKPVEEPETDMEKRWGLLRGDPILWGAKQDMRNMISRPRYELEGDYRTLSSIGIKTESADFGKSGKIELDESKLMEGMLKDPGAVKDLVKSVASEMKAFSERMISTSSINVGSSTAKEGKISNRIDRLEKNSEAIDERISDLDARLEMEKASLNALYANMEANLARMNKQSSYLSSLTGMSGNNNT